MILVDYNGLCIPVLSSTIKNNPSATMDDCLHAVLNSLLNINMKWKSKYGSIIICHEGRNNWRKKEFKYFKTHRKTQREKSKTDWNFLFTTMEYITKELENNFQWRNLTIDESEADDLIAVLCKAFPDEDTLIVSRDSDFFQLHTRENLKQYDIVSKKFIKPGKSPDIVLFEKICKGSSKETIPNVLMPVDHFVNGEGGRQKPITKKVLENIDVESLRYIENQKLIDFSYIPRDIQRKIYNEYKKEYKKPSLMDIKKYLIRKRFRLLHSEIKGFVA